MYLSSDWQFRTASLLRPPVQSDSVSFVKLCTETFILVQTSASIVFNLTLLLITAFLTYSLYSVLEFSYEEINLQS